MAEQLGDPNELCFEFTFEDESPDLAWGHGRVIVANDVVWAKDSEAAPDDLPFRWTWIELLEFLGRSMKRLALEETYPLDVDPIDPTMLRHDAKVRWQGLSEQRINQEDDALFRFEEHHDLARALMGAHMPSLLLLREGNLMWVCADRVPRTFRAKAILDTLESVGDRLAERVANSTSLRAKAALKLWAERDTFDSDLFLTLRSGFSKKHLELVQGAPLSAEFWEVGGDLGFNRDSELLAAARMVGTKTQVVDQQAILTAVRACPFTRTTVLDDLATAALKVLESVEGAPPPYEEGYAVARWLRVDQGVVPSAAVDPAGLLAKWSVRVSEIQLDNKGLDAVACWGPRHGPIVLVNTNGLHSSPQGRNVTLAHELGHLLVDRRGALPLAEAIGGMTPRRTEQRAKAFAAEFLAPQEAVEAEIRASAGIREAVRSLCIRYRVSRQLVGWQIANGSLYEGLGPDDRSFVERITSSEGADN